VLTTSGLHLGRSATAPVGGLHGFESGGKTCSHLG
jgi:hypothetical protein